MGLTTLQIIKILQVKGLGRKGAFKICNSVVNERLETDQDLKDLLRKSSDENLIRKLPDISDFQFSSAFNKANSVYEESLENGLVVLSYYDKDFPVSLKKLDDPPLLLNFKGDFKSLNKLKGIAIIGTREPTTEGIQSGRFFGEYFGNRGYNVVSGLALGCDTSAHVGCLKGNGFTTAIVAHGLHMTYPKENINLAQQIVDQGGVLLSEYLIGTNPLSNYFVERDRLQAGLSLATIVIQTAKKGGTMHAVNATIKSKKLLAAIKFKDIIHSDKVDGNNMLIDEMEAFPLTSQNIDDFIKRLEGLNKKSTLSAMKNNQDQKPEQTTLNF